MSHTSRSNQLAIGHRSTAVGTCGVVLVDPHLQRAARWLCAIEKQMVDDLEARSVLAPRDT